MRSQHLFLLKLEMLILVNFCGFGSVTQELLRAERANTGGLSLESPACKANPWVVSEKLDLGRDSITLRVDQEWLTVPKLFVYTI